MICQVCHTPATLIGEMPVRVQIAPGRYAEKVMPLYTCQGCFEAFSRSSSQKSSAPPHRS